MVWLLNFITCIHYEYNQPIYVSFKKGSPILVELIYCSPICKKNHCVGFVAFIVPCAAYPACLTLILPCFCCTAPFFVFLRVFETCPLFLLPAFQSELRHGPFYYMKQPALTTDPVDVVPQDGRNDFYCWLCHREGQVLCCELCPRVYHAKCLKLPAEPEGDWFCPECEVLNPGSERLLSVVNSLSKAAIWL